MQDITLESLARRVEALERALDLKPTLDGNNTWPRVVGMFADSDFMRQVDEERRMIREAERAQARQVRYVMNHPYSEFELTPLWQVIDAAVSELEGNRDLVLTTAREYVIGYLCQQLVAHQVVNKGSLSKQ